MNSYKLQALALAETAGLHRIPEAIARQGKLACLSMSFLKGGGISFTPTFKNAEYIIRQSAKVGARARYGLPPIALLLQNEHTLG
jgi:hypothetical protein